MSDPVQGDKTKTLTDISSIYGLLLKTYRMIAINILFQDEKR